GVPRTSLAPRERENRARTGPPARATGGRSWPLQGEKRRQGSAQLLHPGPHAGLDRSQRLLQFGRDLVLRQTTEVRELDHPPLCLGQLRERAAHQAARLALLHLAVGRDRDAARHACPNASTTTSSASARSRTIANASAYVILPWRSYRSPRARSSPEAMRSMSERSGARNCFGSFASTPTKVTPPLVLRQRAMDGLAGSTGRSSGAGAASGSSGSAAGRWRRSDK